jgi:hypothetical protein
MLRYPMRYTLRDGIELLRLSLLLRLVALRLRLLPTTLNRRWLSPKDRSASITPGRRTRQKIERLARLTRRAAMLRLGPPLACLTRSLALRARLVAMGVRARLSYGASITRGGKVDAKAGNVASAEPAQAVSRKGRAIGTAVDLHAWLEIGDLRVDTYGTSGSFAPFRRLKEVTAAGN